MVIEQILKEWASALRFFEHKKVVLIFRKGGIHEKEFEEASSYFGIFKTFEHESKGTVKNEYENYLQNTTAEYTGDFDLEYTFFSLFNGILSLKTIFTNLFLLSRMGINLIL